MDKLLKLLFKKVCQKVIIIEQEKLVRYSNSLIMSLLDLL